MKPSISWKNLHLSLGGDVIVTAADMSIFPGVYRIFGRNGAGKSVLLRYLAKLHPLKGTVIQNTCQKILYLTNEDITFPNLTIEENLLMTHRIFGIQQEICCELFSQEQLDCLSREASVGMRQKVGLSLLFVSEFWDLIIIDEGLSHIDEFSRGLLLSVLQERATEGSIVCLVDHQLPSLTWMKKWKIENGVLYEEG